MSATTTQPHQPAKPFLLETRPRVKVSVAAAAAASTPVIGFGCFADKAPARELGLGADRLKAAVHDARAGEVPAPVRRSVTRFVALPLVRLKPDPETDFLAFSVPDAVAAALANVEGLIVRATRDVGEQSDMRAIGRELSADVILTGTLLRVGPQVRVAARLTDAESGTLIWSDTSQAPIDDGDTRICGTGPPPPSSWKSGRRGSGSRV